MPFVGTYFKRQSVFGFSPAFSATMSNVTNSPVPLSVKLAVSFGAVIGGGIALAQNREKVLENTAALLQKGLDFCNEQLEKTRARDERIAFAADFQDNEYAAYDDNGCELPGRRRHPLQESEIDELTTPEGTDTETDYFSDIGEGEGSRPKHRLPFAKHDVDFSDIVSLD